MKYLITSLITLLSLAAHCQQMSYEEWKTEAKSNIRLLPEYGNIPKSAGQKQADEEFIIASLIQDTTHRKASETMVNHGFRYLMRGDVKTAMYRFNQAWLLDPKNENAYWGFGAIYFSFTDYKAAIKMYDKGLMLNPGSSKILTDKATIYMAMLNEKFDTATLNTAMDLFKKSYAIDPGNQNTTYKLSTLYYSLGDCELANKYYNECKKRGGQPIVEEYTKALKEKCK